MTQEAMQKIFEDTAYVRTGGSEEERKCAEYIKEQCKAFGQEAVIEPFQVDMATIKEAGLFIDGKEIPCKGYLCAGNGEVEAPLYYLTTEDEHSLRECKDKIVLIDGYLRYWVYQDMFKHGALGFITYDGNANYADEDIDQRELRSFVSRGNKIPGVNINAKQAISIINSDAKMAKIILKQDEYKGESGNVILDLPGEIDETIVLTAHYDSTSLSQGAYDNMSGSVGLLAIAEKFAQKAHRYGLRFIWCGSEERGLLGSKAYVAAHSYKEAEWKKMVLNINLDMIGCIMGKFIAVCTAEEMLVHYLTYMGMEEGFGMKVSQEVYSSDSTPFADKGVPAVSFARIAPNNTATIHNSYDTMDVMKMSHMEKDVAFISKFVERMANAVCCPVGKEIPDNMKEKLDIYLLRKRDKK